MRSPVVVLLALGVALAGMSGCGSQAESAPSAAASAAIAREDFGIHTFEGKPETGSGSDRMNCWPHWREVQPARGEFDWEKFDLHLAQVESWGFNDVMYSFCGTPTWAGMQVAQPEREVLGPRSTSAPADMADWDAYVTAVVERYKGRITSYDVWNEASSTQFWQGSPAEMADMTKRAYDIVKRLDPEALVLPASMQIHTPGYLDWTRRYVEQLKQVGWPLDVWNVHIYPTSNSLDYEPEENYPSVRAFKRVLEEAGAPPDLPIWDTEINYALYAPGAGGEPYGRIAGSRAAAMAAQTYLNGLRWGIARTYWYMWTQRYDQFPGIQTRAGDPATIALASLADWLVGASLESCSKPMPGSRVVSCRFVSGTSAFDVVWTTSGEASIDVQEGAETCNLLTRACLPVSGSVEVSGLPQRIQLAG